ncbi:hypothetical protein [Brevibacillus marinus]|uniref:hypothetical protein n=1 Tax=Brevibacillus marinus TaxID=2496837 RepID=UPI000F8474E0|nr:hypothetical protein [Brevibacillus marinus]
MIAFTDGKAIIVAIPSKSGGGTYLVRVYADSTQKLFVEHTCPAHRYQTTCSHVEQAVGYWKMLNPWECYPWMPKREVVSVQKHIVLQPNWRQITGKGAGMDATKYH